MSAAPSADYDAPPCCPGEGTMAHVRGCRNHPETSPNKPGSRVTGDEETGSDQHESNEQPAQPVGQESPVPGVQPEGGDHLRGEPRHGVGGVPVVRVREHDGAADVATRCRSGRSVGPQPDAQRCGNFTRHPSGYCHHHRVIPPGSTQDGAA